MKKKMIFFTTTLFKFMLIDEVIYKTFDKILFNLLIFYQIKTQNSE